MGYSVHEPGRRPGRADPGTRAPTNRRGAHVRSEKLATFRPGLRTRPAGPPATKPVGLRRPVFRTAAETTLGQPHVVDHGHGHRHWRYRSHWRHRRLRRTPAFRSPIDHHVPPDHLRTIHSTGE